MLHEVRNWVTKNNLDPLCQFDDYDFLRFCRARSFDVEQVKTMFANFIEHRKAHNMDTLIEDFQYPVLMEIKRYFPHGYHGVDRRGHPVVIESMGRINVPKIFELTTGEELL